MISLESLRSAGVPFTVTTHQSVCNPEFDQQGSCAREVIGVMGHLLFAQLLTSACVSPLIATIAATGIKSRVETKLRRSMGAAEHEEEMEAVTELKMDVVEGEITM